MSSSTTALAPEHLLEEVELRRHRAQQGEEEGKKELLTHCVLCRRTRLQRERRGKSWSNFSIASLVLYEVVKKLIVLCSNQ